MAETERERDFRGVWIPKEIWMDDKLSAIEKVILTEIDSLDTAERGCWASNKYFADFCQCSETTVSKIISKLIKSEYIYVQNFNGRQRILKSRLEKTARLPLRQCEAEAQILQGSLYNNNIYNNTLNNLDNKVSKKESKSNSFDAIISNYTDDKKTIELLQEWLKVRKAKRAAMTDRAIQLNIDKLNSIADKSNMSVNTYLEEVICRGWAAFYEINNYNPTERKQNGSTTNPFLQLARDEDVF